MSILIICTVIRSIHKLHVLIKHILDHNIRFFIQVVYETDLVCDLISDLYGPKDSCSLVRISLFLHRRFGYGILDFFNSIFFIISDLHRRGLAAVDDLAFASLGLQRAFQHLHCQRHASFLTGRNFPDRPVDYVGIRIICAGIGRAHELHVRVQRILDHHISSFTLVVLEADLIRDLVAYLHSS